MSEDSDEEPIGTFDKPLSSGSLLLEDATLRSLWLAVDRHMSAFNLASHGQRDMTLWVTAERDRLVTHVESLAEHLATHYVMQPDASHSGEAPTVMAQFFAAFRDWVRSWAFCEGPFRVPAYPSEIAIQEIEQMNRAALKSLLATQPGNETRGRLYHAKGWPDTVLCLGPGHGDLGLKPSYEIGIGADLRWDAESQRVIYLLKIKADRPVRDIIKRKIETLWSETTPYVIDWR